MPDPVQPSEEVGQFLKDSWINRRLPVMGGPIPVLDVPTATELVTFLLEWGTWIARTSVTIVPSDPPSPPGPTEP
jgi:hypothetical protein